MAVAYLDSSALVKLVREEEEGSAALHTFVASHELVSCEITITETLRAMHRFVQDYELDVAPADVERVVIEWLAELALIVVDTETYLRAGRFPGAVRSLDALHVAAAQDVGVVDVFVTYDERQAAAARLAGFRTLSPGV